MQSEDNKKNRIMEYAFKQFTGLGFAQATMDDIARGVGMGKGTLYKLFPSKEVLLLSTIDYYAARIENAIDEILSDDKLSAVEKLSLFLKNVAEKLSALNPMALASLERYMPEAYEKVEMTRQRIILTNVCRLLREGKESGIIDQETDEKLVAHMLIGAVRHLIESKVVLTLGYTVDQLFKQITSIVLKGCLTKKGRELV